MKETDSHPMVACNVESEIVGILNMQRYLGMAAEQLCPLWVAVMDEVVAVCTA